MKSRYKILFKKLSSKKEYCFIPFVVLGDPSMDVSLELINILIKSGADALELGIPFSDPISDGIIIQKAHDRALKNNVTVKQFFGAIQNIRCKYPTIPIGILTYANLILYHKLKYFYSCCSSYGVDSVLIADVPIEESYLFKKIANMYKVLSVFACPPDANADLVKKIADNSQGYVYLVSRPGVTGIQKIYSNRLLVQTIKKLKKYQSCPIIQGFGINKPMQVKDILKTGIQGIVCGSCIVKIIEDNIYDVENMLIKMKKQVIRFKTETKNIFT
ncbi:tryptophan synthase subunit alpha [Buchnera aphidicola]|uniref:Tryptophan synthase alpha chain n=1 Tax=Buchnera aphidicola (Cinara cf. splendens/pseudotsugae 3390) TaxID=2518980 RepID=A0A451CWS7_9GAMM|nr:tryptophan synthase subunit alpha [Buchnera aphidicola]VFP77757.1 Tryptophan synthase alpha chain [Buchnera aphidicola (Cinara cf. splendens/pseudotsugae 3390)]